MLLAVKARNAFFFSTLALSVSLAGCSKKEEPQAKAPSEPSAPAVTTAAAAKPTAKKPKKPPMAALGGKVAIEWSDPGDWKRVKPKSRMRKAQWEIPAAGGDKEPAVLTLFYFGPGQGGGVDANINRWIGQFKDLPKDAAQRSERSVNDLTQHIVEVESGTYSGTAMGPHAPKTAPKTQQGLLGAVVEAPSGKYFFKMSGPTKTVKAARETFFKFLDGVKAKSE